MDTRLIAKNTRLLSKSLKEKLAAVYRGPMVSKTVKAAVNAKTKKRHMITPVKGILVLEIRESDRKERIDVCCKRVFTGASLFIES
jgi:hypothetical protein